MSFCSIETHQLPPSPSPRVPEFLGTPEWRRLASAVAARRGSPSALTASPGATINRHQNQPWLLDDVGQGACEEPVKPGRVQVLSLGAAFGPWTGCEHTPCGGRTHSPCHSHTHTHTWRLFSCAPTPTLQTSSGTAALFTFERPISSLR